MTKEINKIDIIAMLKGMSHKIGYSEAVEFEAMGLGEMNGFPNEKWQWNDKGLENKNEYILLSIYENLKML